MAVHSNRTIVHRRRYRSARIHCVPSGPRASHPFIGGKCGHCTDTLSIILLSLQGQTEFRRSGGSGHHHFGRVLVLSPQLLFGLQGSSARGLRRPALALAVLAHVQHVSPCVLRLPVWRSLACFLLRCQHAWRLQNATTGVLFDTKLTKRNAVCELECRRHWHSRQLLPFPIWNFSSSRFNCVLAWLVQ